MHASMYVRGEGDMNWGLLIYIRSKNCDFMNAVNVLKLNK